jgi:hypothetical protein
MVDVSRRPFVREASPGNCAALIAIWHWDKTFEEVGDHRCDIHAGSQPITTSMPAAFQDPGGSVDPLFMLTARSLWLVEPGHAPCELRRFFGGRFTLQIWVMRSAAAWVAGRPW